MIRRLLGLPYALIAEVYIAAIERLCAPGMEAALARFEKAIA